MNNRIDYQITFGDRVRMARAQFNVPVLQRMVQVAQYRVQDLERFVPWPALIDSWQRDLDAAEAALEMCCGAGSASRVRVSA